ncbi:hypothetical protein FRB94_005029 [Tulasnella sp. JGI-2019a]|nr:hypothetical protein FRB94_005029 [Tulasnella sp. JGI-2019a]
MTTRNYAHLMLFVDELLIKFLEYLHRPRFPTDFADIDAAGLACKAWRDPSLTVKWREVDLKVLLSALAPLRKPLSIWCFAHAPTDSDIYHFHDVTRRVYTLKSFVDMHLGHLILDAISKSLSRSTVLLPNLHSLRLGCMSAPNVARLTPLIPSTLRHLDLFNLQAESHIILQTLTSRFSQLSTIKFGRDARNLTEEGAVAELLWQNADLRNLTIIRRIITTTIVNVLSQLPCLESLDIGTGDLKDSSENRTPLPRKPFPQLLTLTCRLVLDTTVSVLLADIGAHHSLRTLRLISPYSGSKKSDLEATVAAITTHRLLRHLSLRHPTLKTFWASTLLALASCTMLESLEISIPIDSDIITESSDDAPITDEVVVPIAFTPIPRERRAKRPRILIFSQTVTGMDDVPIDDPEYVAAVLAQLSPEVEIRMENGLKGWPRWDQVARISSKANGVLDTEVIDREE